MTKTFTEIIFITNRKKCCCINKTKKSIYHKKNKPSLLKHVLVSEFWIKLQNKFNNLELDEQIYEARKIVY